MLGAGSIDEDGYSSWELLTRNFLEKAFGTDSPNVSSIMDVGKYGSFPMGAEEEWWDEHRRRSLTTQISKLRGLVELLKTEAQLQETKAPNVGAGLVHGHNRRTLEETARFLEKLDQEVVILHEQPNVGRTIIEKFEDYSDVGFAVVLLTGDDQCSAVDGSSEPRPRARQNVIFELGYFIGRLGRNRVSALYEPKVELPSDYSGVLYIPLDDAGAWRIALAKELKAAGLPVDINKAL